MAPRNSSNTNGARKGRGRATGANATTQNARNGSSQGRTQPTCNNCGQTGHKARDCQRPAKCTRCKKVGHATKDCRHDPANQQNNGNQQNQSQSQNTQSNTQNSNRTGNTNTNKGPFPMAGFTFANGIPTYNGTAPYCPTCNETTHHQRFCPNPIGLSQLQYSVQVCIACSFRGHTVDECRHPDPSHQRNICGVCHKAGHTAEKCLNETQKKFKAATNPSGASRFVWNPSEHLNIQPHPVQQQQLEIQNFLLAKQAEGLMMTPEAEAQWKRDLAEKCRVNFGNQGQHGVSQQPHVPLAPNLAVPTPPRAHTGPRPLLSPFQTPPRNQNNAVPDTWKTTPPRNTRGFQYPTPPNTQQHHQTTDLNRLEALRAHAHRSATLYARDNYSLKIQTHKSEILSRRLLSDKAAWGVSARIAQGVQFWRDPFAMEAIISGRWPECYTCGIHGTFLDREMNVVADRDPLTLVDDTEWGIFIMFDCKCCKNGWSYNGGV